MNTFKKEERLCSKKLIDLLFKNGSSFLLYPFRITYLAVPGTSPYPVKVVINVAKKRYKRAVDRNLIKRRTREAYRLHKEVVLYQSLDHSENTILLSVQFIGKEKYPFSFFEKKLELALIKLVRQLAVNESH